MLYMWVRYASPSGPMCLMCTLSSPVEWLFWLGFIASKTCVVVNVIVVVCSLCVFLTVCLFVFCVLCVGELFVECVWYVYG